MSAFLAYLLVSLVYGGGLILLHVVAHRESVKASREWEAIYRRMDAELAERQAELAADEERWQEWRRTHLPQR